MGFASLKVSADSDLSFDTYKGCPSNDDSYRRRASREPVVERQVEPVNIGLGGGLMMVDW